MLGGSPGGLRPTAFRFSLCFSAEGAQFGAKPSDYERGAVLEARPRAEPAARGVPGIRSGLRSPAGDQIRVASGRVAGQEGPVYGTATTTGRSAGRRGNLGMHFHGGAGSAPSTGRIRGK